MYTLKVNLFTIKKTCLQTRLHVDVLMNAKCKQVYKKVYINSLVVYSMKKDYSITVWK